MGVGDWNHFLNQQESILVIFSKDCTADFSVSYISNEFLLVMSCEAEQIIMYHLMLLISVINFRD